MCYPDYSKSRLCLCKLGYKRADEPLDKKWSSSPLPVCSIRGVGHVSQFLRHQILLISPYLRIGKQQSCLLIKLCHRYLSVLHREKLSNYFSMNYRQLLRGFKCLARQKTYSSLISIMFCRNFCINLKLRNSRRLSNT